MKVKVFILTGTVVLLNLSAVNDDVHIEGLSIGDRIPGIESLGEEQNVSFQNQNGSYSLLNFWASYDANSRVRNIRLSNFTEKSEIGKLAFYSVSVDESPSVFSETVRIDRLNRSTQFHAAEGANSKIYRQYKLKKGLTSYLINDKGVIIAKNVTPEQLKLMMENNYSKIYQQ